MTTLNALGYTLADRTTRYKEALELIDRARVAEPGNAAIIDSYGWVLFRLGRNAEALDQLRRAYTLQKDADIASHLGLVLWVMGRKDEARRYFDEARKIDPDNRSLQRALQEVGASNPAVRSRRPVPGSGRLPKPSAGNRSRQRIVGRGTNRGCNAGASRPASLHWACNRQPVTCRVGRCRAVSACPTARMAAVAGSNGTQGAGRTEVILSAPVTRQSWTLTVETGGVVLAGVAGGPLRGADAGQLLRESTGWEIPVAALGCWLRGAPADATAMGGARSVFGIDQRLLRIEQDGWVIDYANWQVDAAMGVELPTRINAEQASNRVRLVVDRWGDE